MVLETSVFNLLFYVIFNVFLVSFAVNQLPGRTVEYVEELLYFLAPDYFAYFFSSCFAMLEINGNTQSNDYLFSKSYGIYDNYNFNVQICCHVDVVQQGLEWAKQVTFMQSVTF